MKYKHAGMARNFIQNKADLTQYYINRAKKEEEKNQFKIVDTRRVKIPTRKVKSTGSRSDPIFEPSASSPVNPSAPILPSSTVSTPLQIPTVPDCRFLLAWSYYLASQTAWLSPSPQRAGQPPSALPPDPEIAAKFFQTVQNVFNPLVSPSMNHSNSEAKPRESLNSDKNLKR